MYSDLSINDYLKQLSSEKPVPGGGGTSALTGALGIALVLMVSRITIKKQEGERKAELSKTIERLERLFKDISQVIDLDPQVYEQVMSSYAEAKHISDPKLAQEKIESALKNSFRLQADLAMAVAMAKELLKSVGAIAKGSIRNDLIVASGLLDGAFQGAVATANINVVYMKNEKERTHCEQALSQLKERYAQTKFE